MKTRFIKRFAKFENLDEIAASDNYLEIQDGNEKRKFKRFTSRMNDDDAGGDVSFEKKHKPKDFNPGDDDVPF